MGVTGVAAMLAGCSPGKSYSPFDEDASGVGINISGTAVTGVGGASSGAIDADCARLGLDAIGAE